MKAIYKDEELSIDFKDKSKHNAEIHKCISDNYSEFEDRILVKYEKTQMEEKSVIKTVCSNITQEILNLVLEIKARDYRKTHVTCPKCKLVDISSTLVGYIAKLGVEIKDENDVFCQTSDCDWKGKHYELQK